MSKKYDRLWVFGDSYTTAGLCVRPQDSFWGLLAQQAEIPTVINCSRPGNSVDSVCHLLVSLQNEYDWERDLFLIGIPPLERVTVSDGHNKTYYPINKFDVATWLETTTYASSHRGLVSLKKYGSDQQLIIHSDRAWTETQALRTIFLMTTWLDSKNANYMILNLSQDFDKNNFWGSADNIWGASEFVLPYAIDHSRCILFENTYYGINVDKNRPADFDLYGWMGHHGPAGNRYFFEKSLWPQLEKCNLV